LVSVDSLDGKNKIIWEKTSNQGIKFYKIYKQNSTTSQFDSIAIVHYDSFSVYKDLSSNPSQQSASYRITSVDSCDTENLTSSEHTTIHLSANQGVNNNVNLQWNAYLGFNYPNFEIYRSNNGAPYNLIGTVANTSFSYTDLTPPTGSNYYYVAVSKPSPCNPTKVAAVIKSVSNILDGFGNPINSTYSLSDLHEKIKIFPNPSTNFVYVENRSNFLVTDYTIIDILGKVVQTQKIEGSGIIKINTSNLKGNFFIQLNLETGEKLTYKLSSY
jgi:hypothetical protein